MKEIFKKLLVLLAIAFMIITSVPRVFADDGDESDKPLIQVERDGDQIVVSMIAHQEMPLKSFNGKLVFEKEVFSFDSADQSGLPVSVTTQGDDTLFEGTPLEGDQGIIVSEGSAFLVLYFNINADQFEEGTPYEFYVMFDSAMGNEAYDWGELAFRETYMEGECVHNLKFQEGIPATCEDPGVADYWYCDKCWRMWFDEELEQEILDPEELVLDPLGHLFDYEHGVVTTEPTCEDYGVMTYYCERNHEHTETEPIDPIGHNYVFSSWIWDGSTTLDGNTTWTYATAVFKCTHDQSHILQVAGTITPVVTAPTCETDGYTTYNAKAIYEGHEYTDSKKGNIVKALGHLYKLNDVEWDYADPSAKMTLVCERDHSHVLKKDADVTEEVISYPKDGKTGTIRYTASVKVDGVTFTETKDVKAYLLTFDFNGGKSSSGKESETMVLGENRVIKLPKGPIKMGASFDYWEGSKYAAGEKYKVTENHTFKAIYVTDGTNKNMVPTSSDGVILAAAFGMIVSGLLKKKFK